MLQAKRYELPAPRDGNEIRLEPPDEVNTWTPLEVRALEYGVVVVVWNRENEKPPTG